MSVATVSESECLQIHNTQFIIRDHVTPVPANFYTIQPAAAIAVQSQSSHDPK